MNLTRHWRDRDFKFIGTLVLTLSLIVLYLGSNRQVLEAKGSGWRRIDIAVFQQRLERGDLSEREADWYHREGAAGNSID